MRIRAATPEDVPAMMQLEGEEPVLAHWSERQYHQVFSAPPKRIAFIAQEGSLVGFVIAQLGEDCELENIVVQREHRRKGAARRLLHELENSAKNAGAQRILLEVRDSNTAARAFYASCGFAEQGRRSRYYAAPEEDAILMAKPLTSASA